MYRLLGDEYDIIPGKGGTRNNAIKEMGITTYLVRTKTTDRTTPIEVCCCDNACPVRTHRLTYIRTYIVFTRMLLLYNCSLNFLTQFILLPSFILLLVSTLPLPLAFSFPTSFPLPWRLHQLVEATRPFPLQAKTFGGQRAL